MTNESNSSNLPTPEPIPEHNLQPDDFDTGATENHLTSEALATQQALAAISSLQSPQHTTALKQARSGFRQSLAKQFTVKPRALLLMFCGDRRNFSGYSSQ